MSAAERLVAGLIRAVRAMLRARTRPAAEALDDLQREQQALLRRRRIVPR